MSTEYVSEITLLPDGMEVGDDEQHAFAVKVVWRGARAENGSGGYGVSNGPSKWLSRAGKWGWPERFQYRQYRWETLEEALAMARTVVNDVTVNRFTWAQWQEKFGTSSEPPKAD